MKAQELRIGNIVTINNPEYHPRMLNIPLKVVGISPNVTPIDCLPTFAISLEHLNQEQNTYFESYSQFIKFIEPIPLTDEILRDWCGFEKDTEFLYDLGDIRVYIKGKMSDSMLTVYDFEYKYTSLTHLFYLHQLQNLHFSLTGEELPVKIPTT